MDMRLIKFIHLLNDRIYENVTYTMLRFAVQENKQSFALKKSGKAFWATA